MCEVCAIFGAGEHWSDFGRLRNERLPFADIQHYREERRRRIGLLNAVLSAWGVRCEDWDGEACVVVDASGRQVLAPTLNDIWPTAERLSGRAIDPLLPEFAAGLDHD